MNDDMKIRPGETFVAWNRRKRKNSARETSYSIVIVIATMLALFLLAGLIAGCTTVSVGDNARVSFQLYPEDGMSWYHSLDGMSTIFSDPGTTLHLSDTIGNFDLYPEGSLHE